MYANTKIYPISRSISLEVILGLVQETSGFLLESFHVNYDLKVRVIICLHNKLFNRKCKYSKQ